MVRSGEDAESWVDGHVNVYNMISGECGQDDLLNDMPDQCLGLTACPCSGLMPHCLHEVLSGAIVATIAPVSFDTVALYTLACQC